MSIRLTIDNNTCCIGESTRNIVLLMLLLLPLLFVAYLGYFSYNDAELRHQWELTEGKQLRETIVQHIQMERDRNGLTPVKIVDEIHNKKVTIIDTISIDTPTISTFEDIVLDEDIRRVSVTIITPPSMYTIETSRSCDVDVSGVW